jgi:hypothetical protein
MLHKENANYTVIIYYRESDASGVSPTFADNKRRRTYYQKCYNTTSSNSSAVLNSILNRVQKYTLSHLIPQQSPPTTYINNAIVRG